MAYPGTLVGALQQVMSPRRLAELAAAAGANPAQPAAARQARREGFYQGEFGMNVLFTQP